MFLKLVHKCYKDCAVPQCKSNTYETPYKLFFTIPKTKESRKQWLALARALGPDLEDIPSGSRIYFCSDHFDLPNDMLNYMDYYKTGSLSRVSLIKGCMPSKFDCQYDKSSPSDTPQDNTDSKQCNIILPKLEPHSLFISNEHSLTNDIINHDNDPLIVKEETEDVKEETMLNGFSSNGYSNSISDTVTVKIEKPNHESVETKEVIKSDTIVENIEECMIKNNNVNKNSDMVIRSCDVCYEMVFSRDYTTHLRKEHDIKRYSCRKCNKIFKTSYNLKWHNRVHAYKKYKCEICSKGFSKACNLATHKYLHEDERYACNMCDKPFFLLSQLRSHVRVAHEGNRRLKASKVDHVSHMLGSQTLSVTGIKTVSGYNFKNQISDPLTARKETEEKEKMKLNYSSNNEANTFSVIVNNEITNDLSTELEEGKLVKDNLTVDIEKCDIKTEIEMNEDTYVNNRSGHLFSEKTVKNDITNDLPTDVEEAKLLKDNLTVDIEKCDIDYEPHLKVHYINAKTLYPCKTCHKTFSLASRLKEHMYVHKREMPYACNLCDKTFSSVFELQDHISHLKRNSRKTLYPCKTCHKTFSLASRLKAHMYVHKREMPYACNLCDKTYSSLFDLQDHKVHETQCYACKTCNKTYPRLYDLKVHIQVHTGQKLHACTSCHKTFSLAHSLKEHMNLHRLKKPFACALCNETFDVESLLENHKLDHARKLDTVNLAEKKQYYHYGRLKRSHNILVTDVQTISEEDFSKKGGNPITVKEETM